MTKGTIIWVLTIICTISFFVNLRQFEEIKYIFGELKYYNSRIIELENEIEDLQKIVYEDSLIIDYIELDTLHISEWQVTWRDLNNNE